MKPLSYAHKGDLTTGHVHHHLMRLSIPMLWSILAIISLQLIDTYFISMLGTTELAGISFTFPVTMLISHLVFGFNVAISSVVSRLIGEKRMDDVKRITLHGMGLALCASSVVALLCYIFLDPIFELMGADETTMPVVRAYMPLWLLGSAILAIPVNANSAMRAAGDSFWPSMTMLGMALINLALAPVLIFGLLGFPALGVMGAALATFIAQLITVFTGLYILISKKDLVALDGLHLDKFKDSCRRLLVIAVPAGITNTIGPVTNAIILAFLATYGSEAVAAFGVATRIEAFALLFVIALALGMAPIVGQNWGAGIHARAHEAIRISIMLNLVWSFAVAGFLGLCAHFIAREFSSNPDVIRYTTLFFSIVPFSYAFSNLVFGWSSAFNAMGRPARSFVMILCKSFVFTLPAVYIGHRFFGIAGIFTAIAVSNVAAGLLFHGLSRRAARGHERELEKAL
ncbi:MAG: MATE family efflux transporter [Alphaproteobacteria bacterium]